MKRPYNVYGGLQDNGVWKGAHTSVESNGWQQSGQNPWESINGWRRNASTNRQ